MSANVETMFSVREVPWHGLGTIVETVVDGHIQTAGTNTVGKIVKQYVRTVRLDDWTHHAVIELFRPAKHRFQHLRTSLVQALVIHVS